MHSPSNKQIMQALFDELALGNGKPFVAALSDDIVWNIMGNTSWSGSYAGKETVLGELLAPLFAQFETRYKNRAIRMTAEDDIVVVECRGAVNTKSGKAYNNSYCYVCRMRDGRICELTEYLDTQLVSEVLADPA
jgi:uncharacterized protein